MERVLAWRMGRGRGGSQSETEWWGQHPTLEHITHTDAYLTGLSVLGCASLLQPEQTALVTESNKVIRQSRDHCKEGGEGGGIVVILLACIMAFVLMRCVTNVYAFT